VDQVCGTKRGLGIEDYGRSVQKGELQKLILYDMMRDFCRKE
jgi:hypothetical protein